MGDSITSGTIVKWEKSEHLCGILHPDDSLLKSYLHPAEVGDFINQDDVVVVIETDKVAVEVRSPTTGTLVAQLASEGTSTQGNAKLDRYYLMAFDVQELM